ncbi:MAG: YeeE/YedE family protein [Azoarcus sp.]|nr:YeeE/YedE family protein [Azoarcus sp.]
MVNAFAALVSGIIFGIGLLLSGMSDPQKMLAFLDLAGEWDPSLALVMLSAIGTSRLCFVLAARRGETITGAPIQLPRQTEVDRRLVGGSVVFGVGWGLAGLCPGPAIVGLGLGYGPALVLVPALLGGLWVGGLWLGRGRVTPR